MDGAEEIITDEELEKIHGNANFGPCLSRRDVVNQAVLKCASGYYQGSTSTQIIRDHGLINDRYKLTKKWQRYLWAAFRLKNSV